MGTNTTRRDILRFGTSAAAYAAGAAIVTGAAALASQAEGATLPGISPALANLLDQYARADTAIDRWYAEVWNPAIALHQAAREAVPHTAIPVQGYRNVLGEDTPPHTYSTANPLDVGRCKQILAIPADFQNPDPRWQDTRRAARQLTTAAKWRERKLSRIQRQWEMLGHEEHEERLWRPIRAATGAILAFPIASASDLGAKLDHMEVVGTCESDPDKYQQIIRDDVRRLSAKEGR